MHRPSLPTQENTLMATATTPLAAIDKNLDTACASVVHEIARTDSKASLLLAFDGAVLAGLASLAEPGLPTVTKTFGALAVLALGVSSVLLLLVVRPRLRGDDKASFPHWARLKEDEIRACMQGDSRPAQIGVLSCLAVRKFTQLRRAVDMSLAALVLLAPAAAGLAL
ncbi:Pycsar system effector family protein [Streptomyces sp. NPDC091290]|uniref:Pycsar system effector family protein n=1 Tax=Streptomyces sp. NPDC091290 TaxID=3365990 RepID=UPI0038026946